MVLTRLFIDLTSSKPVMNHGLIREELLNRMTQQQQSKRRAASAGLTFVNDFDKGYSRRRCGKGFIYLGVNGRTLSGRRILKRIESLVIPPAWEDVWICPTAHGHIQARGRDNAGRLQYIYHPDWKTISAARKFDRMSRFADVLPRVRRRIRRDLNRKGLPRERVQAAIVRIMDRAHLRIGNDESRNARGATTLLADDVDIQNFRVSLDFPGKSGQQRQVEFFDRKLVRVIERCEELDGQFLFAYQNNDTGSNAVSSTTVNAYLREIADERITAKDFRTWTGSSTALSVLADADAGYVKRNRGTACRNAVKAASARLGNSPAVCRKSYIHPGILAACESDELREMLDKLPGKAVSELTMDDVRFKELLPQLSFS